MSGQFQLTSKSLPRTVADRLSDALDACPWPEALSVSMIETDEARDLWRVEAIYADDPDTSLLEAAAVRAGIKAPGLSIAQVPDTDWVRQSLEGLAPVRAGRLVVHGRHDRHVRSPGTTAIEIDAGLAFGTGHHDTTLGCLEAAQSVLRYFKPLNCLDVGCGTGVLAIAAAKLARIPVLASDIDPEAVAVAQTNIELNGVAPLVKCMTATGVQHREITAAAPYDLIFANILARPLVSLAPALTRILSRRGRLILAGLTNNQVAMVRAAYSAQGVFIVSAMSNNGWAVLTLGRQ